MRFDRDGVLGRVMRPDRDVGEPEPRQQGTHAALGKMHAVSSFDDLRQIGPPPANDAVLLQIGPGANQGCHFGLLLGRQARRRRPAALVAPDVGQCALLTNAGLVLPPELDRLAPRMLGDGGGDESGEVFLCASIATGSWAGL